jgi:hypothetical protein
MPRRRAHLAAFSLVLAALSLTFMAGGAEPAGGTATVEPSAATVIAPEDALEHVGEECTVEFVVEAGRKLDDKEICFLNSMKDHRDSHNFTAVILRTGLARYGSDGIDDPADEFRGKTIRVTGTVEERNEQAQIVVESPTQIEVVAEPEAVSPTPQDR